MYTNLFLILIETMAEDISRRDAEALKELRSQEVSITRELIDLRDKLVTLSRADVINLEEVANIQAKSLQLEQQRQGVTKQIVSITGQVLETDQKRADVQERSNKNAEEALKTTKEVDKITTEELKKSKERELALKRAGDTVAEMKQGFEKVEKSVKAQTAYEEELLRIKQQQSDVANLLQIAAQNSEKEGGEYLRAAQELANTSQLVTTNVAERAVAEAAAREGKFTELDIEREMRGIRRANIEIETARATGNLETVALLEREVAMLEEEVSIKKESNALNQDLAKNMKSVMETSERIKGAIEATPIGGLIDGIKGAMENIPGGAALGKALGVDSVAEDIKKNLGDTMTNVVSGFQQGGAQGMEALSQGAQSFGKALMAGPQAAIILMVAAVGALIGLLKSGFDAFDKMDKQVSEVQKKMGGTKDEAVKTFQAAQGMAQEMGIVGVNSQEVVKGMATVSELMGGLDVATQIKSGNKELEQFAKDATVLSEKFGMSAEEIGNIKALATMTGESMGSLVKKGTGLAKGLMTDKEAMKTLASVPKSVSVAFKGGTESLIKAAQKAKMLGQDLGRVQEIGDGMLDIESSLAKEMEARVLTGKQLNLDAARQLALAGDVAGLQDELLNQAGSLEEFQNMNRLQQKSMADAMGMSVEEMTNMLTKAQEYRDVGLDSAKITELQNMNQKQLADEMKNTSSAEQRAYIEKIAKEKEAATMAEQFGDIMTKIQEKITALLAPLVSVIHGMFDAGEAAGGITSVLDGVFAVLTPIFDIVMGIGKIAFTILVQPFKLLFSLISPIFDAVKSIFAVFDSGKGSVGGISDIFTKINDVLSSVFGVFNEIASVVVGMLIEPLKMMYISIVTPIWEAFTGIFDAVSKAFAPLSSANETGEQTAGIMDTVKKIFESLTPVIAFIGELFAKTIIKPIKLFSDLISFVVKLFTGDFQGAVDQLGTMLMDQFLGIPKMIIEALAGVIDAIFGTNLTAGVGKFFDFVKGIFDDVASYVMNIGALILDYLMAPFDLVSTVIDGIVQMFSGDFMGGLETIGGGIADFIMAPFDLVSGLFDNLMGTIGKITDKVSGALSIFGIGGDEEEAEKKSEETKGAGAPKPAAPGGGAAVAAAAANMQKSPGGGMTSPDKMTDEELMKMGRTRDEYTQDYNKSIGAAAAGGIIKKGGATLVGEKGPEVVSLPQGSVVANASATQQAATAMGAMGGGAESTESPELLVLQSMDSKISALLEPLQKLGEVIGSIGGSIAGGAMSSIGSAIGGLFGGEEKSETSPMSPVSTVSESPMGVPAAFSSGGESAAAPAINLANVESKLDNIANILNSAANQPTYINISDRTIEEIRSVLNMKESYNITSNIGNGRRV
jgi:hypothetical protein